MHFPVLHLNWDAEQVLSEMTHAREIDECIRPGLTFAILLFVRVVDTVVVAVTYEGVWNAEVITTQKFGARSLSGFRSGVHFARFFCDKGKD